MCHYQYTIPSTQQTQDLEIPGWIPAEAQKNGAWGQHAPNRGGHVETKVWELQAAKRLRSSQFRFRPFPATDSFCKCGPQTKMFRFSRKFFQISRKKFAKSCAVYRPSADRFAKVLPQSRLKRTVLHHREEKALNLWHLC